MQHQPTLSLSDARRALYIDFEGRVEGPPSFLGILPGEAEPGDIIQLVTEERLWPLSVAYDRCKPCVLPDAVADLLDLAERESRRLIAWSDRERKCFESYGKLDAGRRRQLDGLYVDAKSIAKTWKARVHPQAVFKRDRRRGTHRLKHYCRLVGYVIPRYIGDEKTGERIDRLRKGLERHQDYVNLPGGAKRAAKKLLDHNLHDCAGMREVVLQALSS